MKTVIYVTFQIGLCFSTSTIQAMEISLTDRLVEAIKKDDFDKAQQLLEQGADPNAEYSRMSGAFPLSFAVRKGREDLVRLLLLKGAQVDYEFTSDITNLWFNSSPLQIACEQGHAGVVAILIEEKASINYLNKVNHTPLQNAIASGNWEVVELLLAAGAEVNPQVHPENEGPYFSYCPCEDYIMGPYQPCCPEFRFSSTACSVASPLISAIKMGDPHIVGLLLKYGAKCDVCEKDIPLIVLAYLVGNRNIIKMLEEKGCNIASYSAQLIILAAQLGNNQAIELLLEKQEATVLEMEDQEYKATPLLWAANEGHVHTCTFLIEQGANLAARNNKGWSTQNCVMHMIQPLIIKLAKAATKNELNQEQLLKAVGRAQQLGRYAQILKVLSGPQSLQALCRSLLLKKSHESQV